MRAGEDPIGPSVDQLDLFCASCGYNMRGLSGHPRTCPECGIENTIRDLLLPEPLVTKSVSTLESLPTTCVVGTCTTCLGMALAALAIFNKAPTIATIWVSILATISGAGLSFFSTNAFARSCNHAANWRSLLISFHLVFLAGVATIAAFACALYLSSLLGFAGLLCLSPAVVILIVGSRIIYDQHKKLQTKLRGLQRHSAIKLARKHLERRHR